MTKVEICSSMSMCTGMLTPEFKKKLQEQEKNKNKNTKSDSKKKK